MTSLPMRCASKAASEAAARMRAAGNQATQASAPGVSSLVAADKKPATPNIAGARGNPRTASSSAASAAGGSPMEVDPELEVCYSGESDSPSDSKSPATPGPKALGAGTTTAVPRGSRDLRREMFGSSDESEHSSWGSKRSRSHSYDVRAKHEDVNRHDDVDDSSRGHRSRSNTSYCGTRSASTHVGTTQEEKDRNALRSATEKTPWMPSLRNRREWYSCTTGSCRIPLFVSAKDYRTEHEYYIDVFFRHRWYHGNRNRDEGSLMQAWNSFVGNIENVGREVWLDKLIPSRNKFEPKSPTGSRFKLHRLS
uniref:RxLR effector candidate protein n=1 Tax=Hyaloperonospora arabidopsidis (strain Emoy2) TaxID=559515 RepID=M4BXA6_HYAAE